MVFHARLVAVLLGGLLSMGQAPIPGRADAAATVLLRAEFKSLTSLRVSTSQLRFEVSGDEKQTTPISVQYTAAARTHRGADVVLTVEPVGDVQTAEGEPATGVVVAYRGEGHKSGTLAEAGPHVVGTWIGSGVRPGRAVFTLLGARKPGVYLLSLKFVLSAP